MINMVTASAKVESMEKAFTTLAGATGNSAIALMKLKQATNDTMSEFDLFKQANNAMILGVTRNSDEMAEMFDVAQRLGRALGQDTASSVESLITGIGRQSRLMLDNIGIIVRSEEAYQAYADKLNITVDELSDADKKQAFLNATMEAARQKVQTLGKEILTTQDTFDKLGASSADLAKELGKSLSPVFSTLAKNTSNIFSNLTELLSIFNHTKGAELQFAEATEEASRFLKEQEKILGITIDSSGSLVNQLYLLGASLTNNYGKTVKLGNILTTLKDTQDAYNKALKAGETAGEADKKFKAAKAELKAIDDRTAAEQKAFQEATDKSAKRNFLQEQALKIMQANEKKRVKARKETLKELTRLEKEYHQRQKDVQSQADDQRKAVQDRAQSENEAFLNNINSSIGAVGDFLSAWQSNMKSRMDTEISTLKDSEAYKMADTERRKDMERQITKGYAAEQMKQFRIGQATAIADIGMNTASALMKSVAGSWVTIGQPWFGLIAALGLAQTGMVLGQKPPSFEQGGLVGGQRHSQGGTMIEAEQGEFIMSRSAVSSIGTSALNQMNQGGVGGGITLNISAPLVDEHILDTIIPAIQKAQRMNLA